MATNVDVDWATCQHCGRSPARTFTVRRHVGLLLLMRRVRIKQTLCRDCAVRELARFTGRTLVEGWWSVLSLLVNPATILLNLGGIVRACVMRAPNLSEPFGQGSDVPSHDSKARPGILWPIAIGLLCLLGIAGVVWHVPG
jgi:hypothetical protein